jgi:prephenate dehydratase
MGLRRICADVRYLGSYPRDDDPAPVVSRPGTSDEDFAAAAEWLAGIRRGPR